MPEIPLKDTKKKQVAHDQRPQDRHNIQPEYNSRKWRAARLNWLKQHPLCVDCSGLARVVDHIVPVRVSKDFWGGPFQSMCHSCHNAKTKREQKHGADHWNNGKGDGG